MLSSCGIRAKSLVLCQERDGSGLLGVSKAGVLWKQGFSDTMDKGVRGERRAQTGQRLRGNLGLSRYR